jgi:hypothetical protein
MRRKEGAGALLFSSLSFRYTPFCCHRLWLEGYRNEAHGWVLEYVRSNQFAASPARRYWRYGKRA